MHTRVATVTAAVLVLAGCGGGSEDRLSRADYVAQADAICTKVEGQQKALGAPATLAEIPAFVDKQIPLLDTGLDEIRALHPPADMQAGVDEWLATTGETRDVLLDFKAAAVEDDAAEVRRLGAMGTEIDERRDALARALGLTACANT